MPTATSIKLKERAAGCLVGAAIGDALGMPTEFVKRERFERKFGGAVTVFRRAPKNHPSRHLYAGQYTDDTQQAIILAETIIEKNGFDIKTFGKKMGEWGHLCLLDRDYNRGAGHISLNAAQKLWNGAQPEQSGSTTTESCGSSMRVFPVGLYYFDFFSAIEYAKLSSIATHNTEITMDGAALVAGIVNLLAHHGMEAIESVEKALNAVRNPRIVESAKKAISVRSLEPAMAEKSIGTGTNVDETVGYAVYSFIHTPDDFEKTIINAANVDAGDSDTIACIAGAFSGAYNGFSAIPDRFLKVENMKKLKGIAEKLVEGKP